MSERAEPQPSNFGQRLSELHAVVEERKNFDHLHARVLYDEAVLARSEFLDSHAEAILALAKAATEVRNMDLASEGDPEMMEASVQMLNAALEALNGHS